jgi:hypothetical protein
VTEIIKACPGPTALYRLYGKAAPPLYIGISKDFRRRWRQLAKEHTWWAEVTRKEIEWYGTRDEAKLAEAIAVVNERPEHNCVYANWVKTWESADDVVPPKDSYLHMVAMRQPTPTPITSRVVLR